VLIFLFGFIGLLNDRYNYFWRKSKKNSFFIVTCSSLHPLLYYFRRNTKEQLDSLQKIVQFCTTNDVTVQSIQKRLTKEADKIDRMLIVEDLFAVTDEQQNDISSLAEKSKKMVETIAQGLVETLKSELEESKNLAETQRRRILDLEKEKEEFLEDQLNMKNEGVHEMNELVESLRRSLVARTANSAFSDGENNLKVVSRNFSNIKKTFQVVKNGLDKSYKALTNKTNEISELKETIKEIEDQLRARTVANEEQQEEKQFLKTRIDHSETQHRLTIDELNAVQKRLTAADNERRTLFEENRDLKGGKANMQDFCSNLSGQNDKLLDKIKIAQEERDRVFNDLQEHMHRIGELTNDNNELENKIEALENVITKLRREYQEQTREVNILTRESEDLRHSLEDSEQDRMKIRRSMKSVETGNKDLEDQTFQLTNDLQKLKSDNEKLRMCQRDHQQTIEELHDSINVGSNEKTELELELRDIAKKQKELQDTNKTLSHEIKRDKTQTEKRNTLLELYEKMLMKCLHQRKEMMSVYKVDPQKSDHSSLQLCTSQSIDYKNLSDIKCNIETTSQEIDITFNALLETISIKTNDLSRYELFLSDICEYSKRHMTRDVQADSCYSTDDVEPPHVPRFDVSGGLRGLSALKAKYKCQFSHEQLQDLSEKLKRALSDHGDTDSVDSRVSLKEKRKITNKKIKQLQSNLQGRKSIERNLQNKISHLKKEIKVLKEFHRTHQLKAAASTADLTHINILRSPPRSVHVSPRNPGINVSDLIADLETAREELRELRTALEKQENENSKRIINISLDPVDNRLTSLKDKLQLRVNCSLCEKRTDTSVDQLEDKVCQISEQREYMLEHMKFTNKRLEVLLNCLKGRSEDLSDSNNNLLDVDTNPSPEPTVKSPQLQLTPVKKPYGNHQNNTSTMKRAVSILELTKAISITDLHEADAQHALNEEQRDVIVLVKDMNENMETVLREARSKINEARVTKKLGNGGEGDSNSATAMGRRNSQGKFVLEIVPKSVLLKKENELKSSLEKAQQKLENLSQFLEKREAELKERDEIIAKLNREYEELKHQATDKADARITTRDRMIDEYRTTIGRLEKENEFLQVVVKELRDELMNFQKSYRQEEETQQHLQEFINELQICKASLEKSLDKVAYELNIVKTDRDHLIKSMNSMNHVPSPAYWYSGGGMHNMHHGGGMLPQYGANYHGDGFYDDYGGYNAYAFSEQSTAIPFSEEDWASICDDCDSLRSEGEPGAEGEDVISSSESQTTTTSSRVAKKIKTGRISFYK